MKKHLDRSLTKFNSLTLEHKIFIVIGIIGTIFSFFTAVMNLILDLGIINVIASASMGVFTIMIMVISIKKNTYSTLALITLIVLSFVLYPTIWITSGGSFGTIPYFLIMNMFFIPLVLDKKSAIPMSIGTVLATIGLVVLEINYPEIIMAYPTENQRMIDLGFVLILLLLSAGILAYMIILEYNKKIHSLNLARKQLETLSITDELTGLFNRRYIKDYLRELIDSKTVFSVIMIDIDDFKSINDTYGHSIGDKVLINISKTLNDNLEQNQIAGRLGGEEFLIVIKENYNEKLYHFAEFLRLSIEELKHDGIEHPVTISLGTYSPNNNESIDKVLVEVDKNLYEAKKSGKNTVI